MRYFASMRIRNRWGTFSPFIIFFSQTTQRGEGRGAEGSFTCEGGSRSHEARPYGEVKTINTDIVGLSIVRKF